MDWSYLQDMLIAFQESDGTLILKWPVGEMARARLDDVWENIVGYDSTLHLRVDPMSKSMSGTWQEQSKRFERNRYEREPLTVPKLRHGACYKVREIRREQICKPRKQKYEFSVCEIPVDQCY